MEGDKMIYLDYSATTPVNDEVLESFSNACKKYIGNPNSLHKLGIEANNMIEKATKQIADLLNVKPNEIIYTSGSSESISSNNASNSSSKEKTVPLLFLSSN